MYALFFKRIALAAILAIFLQLFPVFSLPGFAACAVDPDVPLAVTKLAWSFNPKTGLFQFVGDVLNVSGRDVMDPGLVISLLDGAGKEFESGVARSALRRIRPGETAAVNLSVKAEKMPGAVKVLPFFGIAGT